MSNDNNTDNDNRRSRRRRRTIKPLNLIDDIAFRIGYETEPDLTRLDRLLDQVKTTNKKLRDDLEDEILTLLGKAMELSFSAGWKYAENPKVLIFKDENSD